MKNKISLQVYCYLTLIATPLVWAQESLPDNVYARINGLDLTDTLIQQVIGEAQVPPEQLKQVIEQIIGNIVMAQKAEAEGFADREEVKLEFELSRTLVLSRAYLRDFLGNNPITDEQVKQAFIEITNDNPSKEYRVRHILVASEEVAKQLLSDINGDLTKFIEMATKSIDTGSGSQGGELGWATAPTFVPEFSNVMVAQEVGTFSEPVQSQFGWHIIYVDDVRDLPAPELNEQTSEQINESLRQQVVLAEFNRLSKEADIVRNDTKIAGN